MFLLTQAKNLKRKPQVIAFGLVCLSLIGCAKHTRITEDYEFVQPRSYLIDSGSPACALYYKGKKVWGSVLMGDDQTFRDGILVFMATVPLSKGGCNVEPQLYAIRAGGPAVMLSERILNKPFIDVGQLSLNSTNDVESYSLEVLTPASDGVQAVYNRGPDATGADIMTTNDVSWNSIKEWVSEAETNALIQVAPEGNYRILALNTVPKILAAPKN